MYNRDTEILFPSRVIVDLRKLRGDTWQELVERVLKQDPRSVEHLGFVYMMVKLNNCLTCQSDSFRAMRGCTLCACQSVLRYRGSDSELLDLYTEACEDVKSLIKEKDIRI
ncbi:MAG: hypothetical protein AB1345_10925 [Chloroflexota bacterium]